MVVFFFGSTLKTRQQTFSLLFAIVLLEKQNGMYRYGNLAENAYRETKQIASITPLLFYSHCVLAEERGKAHTHDERAGLVWIHTCGY